MKPQVGDIIRVREKHMAEVGFHSGLVTQLVTWPEDLFDPAKSPLVDCVVFLDPSLTNPVQIQTRFIEVISRA